jgi:hypothetical protein
VADQRPVAKSHLSALFYITRNSRWNGLLSGAAEQITGIRDYHPAPIMVELYSAGFPFSYPDKVVCSVP